MKRKTFLKIIAGIIAFALLIMLVMIVFVGPWAKKEIQKGFNENIDDYLLDIGKVHISLFESEIALKNINIQSIQEHEGVPLLTGEIESFTLKGVNIFKLLFKRDIDIREVNIHNGRIAGELPKPRKTGISIISKQNIRIDRVISDSLFIDLKSALTAQAYIVKDGSFKVYDLEVEKLDTLTLAIIKKFDIEAHEFVTVTPDSLYTYTALGVIYSEALKTMSVSNLVLQPNYTDYEFTARHQFESDRIEAEFSQVSVHDFSADEYINSGNLKSSSIEIGKMDISVFRDKRKAFRHVNRPVFQESIYSFPGVIHIDSIDILSGRIEYKEHAEEANEPGMIWFDEFKARIYRISNDTVYKTEKAYLELKAEALLMGTGMVNVHLKGRIFDSQNTFALNGTLSGMEIAGINPILEKNAFIYVTSGNAESMHFSFTANNTKSTGSLKFLYHGLNLAMKNKKTDDTTAFKERIISVFANMKVLNSNPMPGKEVRIGIIEYERDPEKFLFNYCVKSIMSGIKSSLVRNPKKKL